MATNRRAVENGMDSIPSPDRLPIVGNIRDFLTMEVHERFYEYAVTHGDMVRFYILNRPYVLINSPDLFEQVMITDRDSYYKQTPTSAFKPLVQDSIFIANKPAWDFGRQHHPYTSEYAPRFFDGMAPAIVSTTRKLMTDLACNCNDQPIDLYPELLHIVFQSFSNAVIGESMSNRLFRDFVNIMAEGAFRLKTNLPSVNPRFWLSLNRWYSFLRQRIASRRSQKTTDTPVDVLDFINKYGTQLSDDLLAYEVSTMVTGGAHPVATALAAVLYLANKHPNAAATMKAEVDSFVDGQRGSPFSLADISGLSQLDWFLHESLRLYSPVAIITRAVKPGTTASLNGVEIPGKTEVFMSSWAMHRSPKYWDDPLEFRPERFQVEPSPLIFFPFGIGERTCVGKPFAEACLKLMLVVMLSEFDITLDASKPLRTTMSTGFVKPKDKIRARVATVSARDSSR